MAVKRHPHSFPKDGVGGGSLPPEGTPEPQWNDWLDPLIGKLPRPKPKVKPTPLKVGGRIFGPVADGGRREPKANVMKRGR